MNVRTRLVPSVSAWFVMAAAVSAALSVLHGCSAVENRRDAPPSPTGADAGSQPAPELEIARGSSAEPSVSSPSDPSKDGAAEASRTAFATPAELDLEPYFQRGPAQAAKADFDARRYASAMAAFDAAADAGGAEQNPARYMAALSSLYAGSHADAARRFEALVDDYPLLADYHHYFAGESHFGAGQLDAALAQLAQVDSKGANAERASELRAQVLGAKKDYRGAAGQWERHFADFDRTAEGQLAYARTLAALGRTADAALAYRLTMARFPLTDESTQAETALQALVAKLPAKQQKTQGVLNAPEELLRGKKLYDAHRSKEAIAQLESAAQRFAAGSEEYCEATYLAARSWDKLRKRPKAHPVYDRARKQCAQSDVNASILYFGGLSYFRSGKNSAAQSYFDELHKRHPKVSFNDDALVWESHIAEEAGAGKKRTQILERSLKDYPDGDMAHEAAWLLVWDHVRHGRWAKASKAARAAGQVDEGPNREYARGRIAYWLARAEQGQKHQEDARRGYREVLRRYPLSWYALLAYARIAEMDGEPRAKEVLREVMAADEAPTETIGSLYRGALAADEALRRGLELLRLGFDSPAQRELRIVRKRHGREADWLLALLYHEANAPNATWSMAMKRGAEVLAHYPTGAHAEKWELAYPRPFGRSVHQHAEAAGVPLPLAYAIMRTESGFDARVESYANAVGLMQLLVGTAKSVADANEKGEVDRHSLKVPDRNIRLGTRFLGRLLSRFGGHPALAAAGYNAGAAPVKKWIGERGGEPLDVFVDSIPYRQTRHYVSSVVGAYSVYTFLETGALPLMDLSLPSDL